MDRMTLTIFDELVQGTPQWHDVRRGIVTASTVGRLLTVGSPDAVSVDCNRCGATAGNPCLSTARGKATAPIKTIHDMRSDLAATMAPVVNVADNETSRGLTDTLVAERIFGFTEDGPMTSDMWRGVEAEPVARDLYSQYYEPATEIGFMRLDADWGTLGYSPDGLVGDDGLIELKAPRAKGHLRTVLAGEVPAYYMPQLQAGLLVSGRSWIDFVPYVGGAPLWRRRVLPDPAWHDAIICAVLRFESTADEMAADYHERVAGLPTTERIDFNTVELKLA